MAPTFILAHSNEKKLILQGNNILIKKYFVKESKRVVLYVKVGSRPRQEYLNVAKR